MKVNFIHTAWLAAALGLAGAANAGTNTSGTAVFGLFDTGAADIKVDGALAGTLGCDVRRTAKVFDQLGDIGLAKPTAFVMLACSKPVLGSSSAALDQLVTGGKRIALFEGDLAMLGPLEKGGKKLRERQYVVKVTVFNNADPAARDRDLATIDGAVQKVADRYQPEAGIAVSRTLGARRPDEVLLMYYESDQAGDRFRTGNPNLMDQIGQFNARHVGSFIYYMAKAQD
jgi:hypothetical protein